VLPALSPFVTWSSGPSRGSRPPRARNAAPQVQWSSESQAHPTTRASLLAHTPQAGDPLVDLVQLLGDPRPHRLVCPADTCQPCVLRYLLEREAEPLRLLDGLHEPHRLLVVVAVPVDPARRLVESGHDARNSGASRRSPRRVSRPLRFA